MNRSKDQANTCPSAILCYEKVSRFFELDSFLSRFYFVYGQSASISMKLFSILGLADLLVLVSGHPRPGPASSIDMSKYRLPALSAYTNTQKVSETRLISRTATDNINYLEAAEEFVRQTVPGLTFRLVDDHYVGKNGIAHAYFKQTVNGLDVGNADFNVNVSAT